VLLHFGEGATRSCHPYPADLRHRSSDHTRIPTNCGTRVTVSLDVRAYALCMATFDGADGTRLAYHQAGEGCPLICLPGGPMQASAYLGDLGGLSAHRWLVLLGPARNRRIRHPGGPGDLPVRSAGRRHRSAARPPRAGPNRPVGTLRRCGAGPAVHHPAPRPRRPSRADQSQPAGGRPGDHRPGSSAGRRTAPGRGLGPRRLRRPGADLVGRRHGR
jgi:hypothetical protein